MKRTCLILGSMFLALSAAGAQPLLPGEFIESVDAGTLLVKCIGDGPDEAAAILRARQGCLEWFILDQLVSSSEGRKAFEGVREKLFQQIDKYIPAPGPGGADKWGSGVKSKHMQDEKTMRVTLVAQLRRRELVADLEALGVRKAKELKPLSIVILPEGKSANSPHSRAMRDLIASYLLEEHWTVLDPKELATRSVRPDEIATASGADTYLLFELLPNAGKDNSISYGAAIRAYETVSWVEIAAAQAISPLRAQFVAGSDLKAASEACRDAMAMALPMLTGYRDRLAVRGYATVVALTRPPKGIEEKVRSSLRVVCTEVEQTKSSAKEARFSCHCRATVDEIQQAIRLEIERAQPGLAADFSSVGRNVTLTFP